MTAKHLAPARDLDRPPTSSPGHDPESALSTNRWLKLARMLQPFVLPSGPMLFIGLLTALLLATARDGAAAGVAVLLVCAISLPGLWDTTLHRLEWTYPLPVSVTGQALVVVGEGASVGRPDIPGSGQLSRPSSMQLLTLLALYRQTRLPIIFSGGTGRSDAGNEALAARRELEVLGVPSAAILVEPASQTTYQNARNVACMLKQQGWTRVTLVVSAFHAPRTVDAFRLFGVAVQPYPTDFQTGPQLRLSWRSWVPRADALGTAALVINELLALLLTRAGVRL